MKRGENIRPNQRGEFPRVHGSAFVDPSALIIGDVFVGRDVFVGPGAVIRADEPRSSIEIGDGSNVQDGVIVHALEGSRVLIGKRTSLTHGCIIHGPCRIGDGCFVGFGSVVFGASVGDGTLVRHLAVVEGVEVGAGKRVESGGVVDTHAKAQELEELGEGDRDLANRVAAMNLSLARAYREMLGD
ncbi:MAG: carbonate dehydratase [Actinobacteria bacterium]|nr:carbonate dehydratase [Actinomycetota bacterium]MDI6830575.1 DapH/DapD/GlmU-related protein [Actinomycetota bacterium]